MVRARADWTLVMLLLPSVVLAAGAVNIDIDWTVVAHFVLFTAFVLIMKDLVFEPLIKVFEERERRTKGAIDQARTMDEQAIELRQEYEERFEGVRREAAVDREQVRSRLKKLEAETLESARQAVATKLEAGLDAIQRQVGEARADLGREQSSLAHAIASRVLGREVRG
jgi:F-type H+-transporting ATPase subunit b